MATNPNASTAGKKIQQTISTFELQEELRQKKERERKLRENPPAPRPDTFKVRKEKKVIT
jgi:hypothetical protein